MPEVFQTYPRFAASLRNVYSNSDVLDGGSSLHKYEHVESLGFQLPSDIKKTFWKEADGDLLLIKPEPAEVCTIYYYAHGSNTVKNFAQA